MANLTNQDTNNNDDFAVGDFVVFNKFDDDALYFVYGYTAFGMLNDEICIKKCTSNTTAFRRVHESHLRHATTAEEIAKRRLPAPVVFSISKQVEWCQPYSPEELAILDMGHVNDIGNHISPLCKVQNFGPANPSFRDVLNKSYMTDVINHLVSAHKAQQEVT
ncbi:hypothetical protein [Acinetobacter sp. Ac_5812]|uniref:hypothetical protein n=1 Tax=Acinetobacter sp. Ac_5812 TaxID=1848937 RepID=UPI00148FEAA8|nr:hypothetical protein [Acinetobacter sp. Ac_5812]NNP68937.1 hypothetical protein [Acinetobacter sp. Ac_5812]